MRLRPRFPAKIADDGEPFGVAGDWRVMLAHHHIVGSESLDRRFMAPGYGAMHRQIGGRRRPVVTVAAVTTWAFLAAFGLSVVGALTGAI